MLFDMRCRFALPVLSQETDLIEPDARQDKGSVAPQTFSWTHFKISRLADALKEQLAGLFPIIIEIVLPGASHGRQLCWRQDPAAGRSIGRGESCAAVGRIAQQDVGDVQLPLSKRLLC